MEEQIQKLREMLSQSRNTVAVTGAGISMAAGIRDMQHLNFLEVIQLMSEPVLKSSPTHYYKIAWNNFLQPMFERGSTVTHKTLARLEGEGKLRGIVTTNIDCLHTLAGSKEVTELQGSFAVNRCTKCGKMHYGARLWGQGNIPCCTQCGGLLSAFPVYNRAGLDREAVKKAQEMISHAELVIFTGAQGCYKLVAKMLKAIHAQESKKAAWEKAEAVVEELRAMKLKEAAKKVEDGIEETLTYYDFPSEHWTRIRTNNMIERLNRKIIYTTNIIEGLNRQFRQITKNKPSFTNDDSLRRMLYLAAQRIQKHWHARCQNWDLVLSQLELLFAGRAAGWIPCHSLDFVEFRLHRILRRTQCPAPLGL